MIRRTATIIKGMMIRTIVDMQILVKFLRNSNEEIAVSNRLTFYIVFAINIFQLSHCLVL